MVLANGSLAFCTFFYKCTYFLYCR